MFFLLTLIIITKRLLYLQVERDKKSTAAANAIRENPGWAGAHIFLLRGGTTLGVVCVCAQESKTARNPSHLLPNSTKQRASVHSKLNNKSHTISSRVSSTIIRRPGKSNNNRKGVKVYQASGGETTITDKTSVKPYPFFLIVSPPGSQLTMVIM